MWDEEKNLTKKDGSLRKEMTTSVEGKCGWNGVWQKQNMWESISSLFLKMQEPEGWNEVMYT